VESRGLLRGAGAVTLAGVLAFGVSACGGSKPMSSKPADPVSTALQAPGVRTVVIAKQSNDLAIVVPPCSAAELNQETTKAPPGSNQVVVPKSALDQTVAIQPCVSGGKNSGKSNSVLLSPGGSGSPQNPGQQQSGQPQNQLLLPKNSNLTKVIVPPCVVTMSSSSSSSGSSGGGAAGGTNTALPATGGKTSVTAPPCRVQMSSSSSSG
jgi:hypothetical protein